MLRELKVRTRQKLGLAFIFSLATFTVVLDIVRTVEAVQGNQDLYTILELNFNVIVSCLPSYRALLKVDQRKSLHRRYRDPSGGYSGDSYGDSSRRSRKGSLPWLNKSRSRSDARVLDHASVSTPGGLPDGGRQGDQGRNIELSSMAWRAQRNASASKGAGPRDPYGIEPESRTSLVNSKDSNEVPVTGGPSTSETPNVTGQHTDRASGEIWDAHRHELAGELC